MTTAQPRRPNPTNASLSIPVSLVPHQLVVRKYPRSQEGLLENKVNRSGDENQMNQAPDAKKEIQKWAQLPHVNSVNT
ncbi:hypothetical protein ALC62_14815 [Cyphomyrmex costatus]|uniref:Uncharacterized protein n=1 Tax=Cyphomyrmex costatus TaxID=456900 RepID=A0A151I883_9HYME|nr:hypothetical protein ALC62_14815 [Cyphomyrmex costatus]